MVPPLRLSNMRFPVRSRCRARPAVGAQRQGKISRPASQLPPSSTQASGNSARSLPSIWRTRSASRSSSADGQRRHFDDRLLLRIENPRGQPGIARFDDPGDRRTTRHCGIRRARSARQAWSPRYRHPAAARPANRRAIATACGTGRAVAGNRAMPAAIAERAAGPDRPERAQQRAQDVRGGQAAFRIFLVIPGLDPGIWKRAWRWPGQAPAMTIERKVRSRR